MMKTAEVST